MKQLIGMKLVHFFLLDEAELSIDEIWGVFGPNGSGKSSLLDAIQIAMCGANERFMAFNAQADEMMSNTRSIRTYCLGQHGDTEAQRVRDHANTYISLIWKDSVTSELLTMGVCINASFDRERFEVRGRYVLRGTALSMGDHLQLVDGERRPRTWETFRHHLLELGKTLNEEPLHPDSERYMRAALLALRGKGGIPQTDAFVRSFRFALRMRFDKPVHEIVRTQVLEPRPTNIKKFREVTDSFKQLSQLVASVKAKVGDLESIAADLDKADLEHRAAVTWRSMAEDVKQSQAIQRLDHAMGQRDDARQALEDALFAHTKAESARLDAQSKRDHFRQLKERHAAHRASADLDSDAKLQRSTAQAKARELVQTVSALRRIAVDASNSEFIPDTKESLLEALTPLDALLKGNGDTSAQDVRTAVRPALTSIGCALTELFKTRRRLENELEELRQDLSTAQENLNRGATGRASLEGGAGRLLNELRSQGLEPQAVCDLVRISDPDWQPVIESYLGANVQALLIRGEADEREAFRIYRGMTGARAVYGAKVAMASKFEQRRSPLPGSVAELIEGEDAAAVNYLRSKFGDAMRATSNEEAFKARHALTTDGMLKTDGEIDRKQPVPATQLKIGAGSPEQAAWQRQEASRLRGLVAQLDARNERAISLSKQLQLFADEDDILRRIALICDLRDTASYAAGVSERKLTETASDDYLELVRQETEWSRTAELTIEELQRQSEAKGVAEARRKAADGALDAAQEHARLATGAAHAARAEEGYDRALVAKRWDKLQEDHPDDDDALLTACENAARAARGRITNHATAGSTKLGQYIATHKDPIFPDVMQDWRKARAWVSERTQHLNDTTLREYSEQMEEAYRLSQATFRNDVALALHEHLRWLKSTMDNLNHVLLSCPLFTNRERYQFRAVERVGYQDLLKFIRSVADHGPTQDLLGDAGELPVQFKQLLEDKVMVGNASAKSPLDDYREFYEFDIEVLREDPETKARKHAGYLSKRLGSGSGGEHRAPLYVIAGAALASTYRLEGGHLDGIRLILLDEAFNKMDMSNIIAAMRYLENLGLQVVMASPGENLGTLNAFLHGYYDIVKDSEHNVVHLEPHTVSEQTRQLYRSDLPEFNPQLIEDEMRSLSRPPDAPAGNA
jgi:chromosome segregation protein